ncbi:MAG: citrate synthase/methylcitrate synthase [Vicinamibacterales bacterium]
MTTLIDAPAGLEGVVAATTAIGDVRGDEGFFHYRGYPAPDLARERSFEEVWHLLHHGRLPDAGELRAFAAETAALRAVPDVVSAVLGAVAPRGTPMAVLRTLVSLAGQDARPWLDLEPAERERQALRLAAMTPSIVAAAWRARTGQAVVAPDPSLGFAADYLRMVTGEAPPAQAARALEQYLLLTIDHGFNASTFTARVVTSTGADLTSAAVAGIAALSGPLHGGAPGRVVDMLTEIGSADRARPWLEEAMAAGRRIMGFGHRVYRTEDPRSVVLKQTALAIGGPEVELAVEVERIALDILDRKYPERKLRTNVEFYAGVVLHQIGLPPELYPPTFAVSRMVGWMAHVLEQTRGNRIIRPASRYVGTDARGVRSWL